MFFPSKVSQTIKKRQPFQKDKSTYEYSFICYKCIIKLLIIIARCYIIDAECQTLRQLSKYTDALFILIDFIFSGVVLLLMPLDAKCHSYAAN